MALHVDNEQRCVNAIMDKLFFMIDETTVCSGLEI
jgi:hypothetical protein